MKIAPQDIDARDDGGEAAPAQPLLDRKAVIVHGGGRDSYQLALALSEAGLLESLVTDLFWPGDREWAKRIIKVLPPKVRSMLLKRTVIGLPSREVQQCIWDGLRCIVLDKLPHVPFSVRRKSTRAADSALGRAAGKRARGTQSGLVAYSYYGFDSMREYCAPAMLFQVHPHPATVRRILNRELSDHPDCASSLSQEWELALPEDDFQHLVSEPKMATKFLVASSFTRDSLIEHGTASDNISVIPYGVDLKHFHPASQTCLVKKSEPLKLLFVGRINQRKGIKYLLQALSLVDPEHVQLTVCGRVVDNLERFRPFEDQILIRPSVTAEELVRAYQNADIFIFPSVAEGFGQVLLEALACGLPILTTTHTAAPDLIEDGEQGFILEPRRPDLLAEKINWCIHNRDELAAMRPKARARAEEFTWERFRKHAALAVSQYLRTESSESRK
jgi:glycosyltransferase involved in cell wall biosynthesis